MEKALEKFVLTASLLMSLWLVYEYVSGRDDFLSFVEKITVYLLIFILFVLNRRTRKDAE
ncbi:MAG: hypothetical protein GXO24_07250 [Chlorobi bacterium]|nr:hypothetical protein [Chlorobiota bacterium]